MQYSHEHREQISAEIKGKTVRSLEWSEALHDADGLGGYWVMTFTDGSVISFRLMVEFVTAQDD